MARFPVFWRWLAHMAQQGSIKIPREQYEEIIGGNGELVDWLKEEEIKDAIILDEEADPELVTAVTLEGYGNLDENGIETVGRDPFLISYGYADRENRTAVTFERSSPGKQGARRKIPDVCNDLGVNCRDLFQLIDELDFTTDWSQ